MQETRFDLIVIGAGPGGYVGAIRAAQLGFRTAIVEAGELGGICLNWGCIPTKALLSGAEMMHKLQQAPELGFDIENVKFDLKKLVQHSRVISKKLVTGIEYLLKKNGITFFKATAQFIAKEKLELTDGHGNRQVLSAPHILVATGASPVVLPQLPVDGHYVWSYREALIPEQLPQSLLVVGSGAIGSEFASLYHSLGSEVTLIDIAPQIMPTEDHEIASYMQKQFEQQGIRVLTRSALQEISILDGQVQCKVQTSQGLQDITVDHVLSAIGIRPNSGKLGLERLGIELDGKGFIKTDPWCKTNVVGIYAIGDVAGALCLAHKASHEAVLCVEKIAGLEGLDPLDRSQIPGCIYTFPQVASIGLTQQQAESQGLPVRIGNFPFQANGKAMIMGDPVGFIKTIIHRDTGEILGVHMVGQEVTELVHGFAIAKTLEATDEAFVKVVFPHPTLSESMHEAMLSAMQRAIHI